MLGRSHCCSPLSCSRASNVLGSRQFAKNLPTSLRFLQHVFARLVAFKKLVSVSAVA